MQYISDDRFKMSSSSSVVFDAALDLNRGLLSGMVI